MPADRRGHNPDTRRPDDYRDHDHSTEDAVIAAFEEPTAGNQHAAELAVALLQRRYDHVLRRLYRGDGTPPDSPTHRHDAALTPHECLEAVLHELAGAHLADRAETLAHGLEALRELIRQRDEARAWARGYEHGVFTVGTDDAPGWLTRPLAPDEGEG